MRKLTLLLSLFYVGATFGQSEITDTIIVSQKRSVFLYFDYEPFPQNEVVGMNIIKKHNDLTFGVYQNIPDSTFAFVKVKDVEYKFRVLQTQDTLLKYEYFYKLDPNQKLVRVNSYQDTTSSVVVQEIKVKRKRETGTNNNGSFGSGNTNINSREETTSSTLLSKDGNQKSINAVVDNDNVKVFSGSAINIRINEPYVIRNNQNQRNEIVIGKCLIENSRVYITVSLHYENTTILYEVYGLDQLKGIQINKGINKTKEPNSAVINDGYKIILKLKEV